MLRKIHVLSMVLFAMLAPKFPNIQKKSYFVVFFFTNIISFHFSTPFRILHFELTFSLKNIKKEQARKSRGSERVEKLCTLIGTLVNLQNTLSYETKFFTFDRVSLNVDSCITEYHKIFPSIF